MTLLDCVVSVGKGKRAVKNVRKEIIEGGAGGQLGGWTRRHRGVAGMTKDNWFLANILRIMESSRKQSSRGFDFVEGLGGHS